MCARELRYVSISGIYVASCCLSFNIKGDKYVNKYNDFKQTFLNKLGFIGALFLLSLCSHAGSDTTDPYSKHNNSWITISGEVDVVSPDSFLLDYGDGSIIVEMDDGDRDADAYKLLRGDKVSVSGAIDDDFFETTSIEASTVYVKKLDTTFYASSLDEEDIMGWSVAVTVPLDSSEMIIYGMVTKIDKEDEFVVDSGLRSIRVETEEMAYNPLDEDGYQKVEIGDRVRVAGSMDYDLFEGREVVANTVTVLN